MPYSITTRDGITIQNIPDDVAPDAQVLKDRVARIRSGQEQAQPVQPTQPQQQPEPGILESIGESITGARRATQETLNLPEWTSMPELNEMSVASLKSALGTMMTNPQETVQVIQANFPDVQIRQDEKGNFILRSSRDQREYAIPPGFSAGDIPRALGSILAFTPAGRATTIPGAVAAGAGTQAAIEATQAATGGEFGAGEVGTAGLLGGIVPAAGRVIQAVKPAFTRAVQRITGKVPESIAPAAPTAPGIAPTSGPSGAAPSVPPVTLTQAPQATVQAAEEIGTLTRKSSGSGIGSATARVRLADLAQVNPEAKAAADRLGIEMPFDVFSDNPQIRSTVGLTRSAAGSEAEAAWRTSVATAVDKADDVIKQFDATFTEGTIAPGVVSQRVRDSLTKTRADLNAEATKVYDTVNAAVPKQSIISMPKLRDTIDTIIGEMGGPGGLSGQERKLLKMMDDGNVTYGRLIREKNLIGQALQGKDSPYGNMEAASLKRLYAALADDQLTNVGNIGGEELRNQLRGANLIYAKERALGKRIINAFGEDVQGSIANKMRAAITTASRGDSAEFSKLIKLVPDDLRKETIATALASVTRSARGAERGGFGFSEFAKTYQGLRANAPVYKQIIDVLGPESHQVMRDLYEISRRITEARANVLTTGKANQAIVEALKAESLVGKVMESTMGKAAATAAAAAGGGPVAAGLASSVTNALASGNKDAVKAAGKMFASDEFQKLAIESATKAEPSRASVRRMAASEAFRKFAEAARLPREMPKREQWILNALQTQQQFEQEPQP